MPTQDNVHYTHYALAGSPTAQWPPPPPVTGQVLSLILSTRRGHTAARHGLTIWIPPYNIGLMGVYWHDNITFSIHTVMQCLQHCRLPIPWTYTYIYISIPDKRH